MGKKNRPLPEPPEHPFGGRKRDAEGGGSPFLLADRMAMAMAEGRLEAFLEEEMPDSEKARKLAMLMMGMTGMIPREDAPAELNKGGGHAEAFPDEEAQPGASPLDAPEELVRAVQGGNVQDVMELLRREHEKRAGSGEFVAEGATAPPEPALPEGERAVVDDLLKIADENRLSVEWIVNRALTMYVREYRKSGRL